MLDFDTSAAEHQHYWKIARKLTEMDTCFMCGKNMEETFLIPAKNLTISGKHAFHIFSVHGIPPELVGDIVMDNLQKAYESGS